ncbi:MAG TPA: rhomboid family intramembrane serine protease [Chryseolinea sp.]
MRNRTDAIFALIAVNAVFYVITHLVPGMENRMIEIFALYFPKNENFEWWQFVTNMFMHGGIMHILFNMYALWAFGSPLEVMWGKQRFLLFYFLCGIGASVIYTLVNYYQFNNIYNELINMGVSVSDIEKLLRTGTYEDSLIPEAFKSSVSTFYYLYRNPAVGASGAIYGVLVAFAILFPNAKLALIFLPVPIAAKYFIPILIALDLFSGITGMSIFGGGIAHFAHIGGAIIGFLLMWYWRKTVPAQ